MKSAEYVLIGVLLVLALAASSCGKEEPQYQGPHLTFEVAKVDFGEIEQQQELTKEVVFKNSGNEVLEITDVKSSCGCTAAVPSDRTIDPGEKGILNVSFKSGRSQGEIEKVITVLTNDTLRTAYRLPVVAVVKTDIELEPRAIDFGEVKLGETAKAEARLISKNGEPFEIIFIEADSNRFDYSISPVEEDGNPGYKIDVTLKPSATPQSFYKVINLRTDNARMPICRLTVVANILGNVKIDPRTVLMRGVMGGDDQTKTITIESVGNATVKLLGAETTKSIVKLETRTLEEGKSYEVVVSYTPDKPGRQKDYLVVRTDDEFEKEVRIPITIFTAKQELTPKIDSDAPGGTR